jgi:septal ring factor EnvC (AmiA/AmiB activator)
MANTFLVIKSHANINEKVYCKGEKVELEDELALFLISQDVVIADVETKLPSEADRMLAIKEAEVAKFREMTKVLTAEIAKLTEELNKTKNQVTALTAKKR